MISYFLRTARRPLADTMTQMGRWFGYRPLYDDLCKLYLTGESENSFRNLLKETMNLEQKLKI